MAQQYPSTPDYDAAMVHHFIRLVGRAPTREELVRFRELRSRSVHRRALRLRRSAARLLVGS